MDKPQRTASPGRVGTRKPQPTEEETKRAELARQKAEAEVAEASDELLKQRLEDVSLRAHKYQREIERLHNEARKREQEASNFIKFLQAEMKAQELKCKDLEKDMKENTAMHLNDKKQMKKTFDATLKRHEQIFLQKEAQLLERNKQLMEELSDLQLFKKMREELATELESTKETIQRNERRHKQQLDDLERKFIAAKQKLEQEALDRIAHSRQVYKEEVGRELDMESKQVRKENREITKELRFHEERSNTLSEDNGALRRKLRQFTTELGLAKQMEEEQVKRGMRQAKQIRELQDKVKTLERSLTHVLRDFELEREGLDRAHQSKVDELERHASGLQDSHETKSRELTEIKRHATTVLAQRNEVEQFLLEALDQVKKEMRARRDADLRQKRLAASASPGSGSQRSASLAASGSVPASQTASARDGGSKRPMRSVFSEMTLEERERVLRLLFAKISSATSAHATQMPTHSFDIQLDGGAAAAAASSSQPSSRPVSGGGQPPRALLPPLPPLPDSQLPPLASVPLPASAPLPQPGRDRDRDQSSASATAAGHTFLTQSNVDDALRS